MALLAARLPVRLKVAAVAACTPRFTALTGPATTLSAIRVTVPALVMVPVASDPPAALTLIATAPPPALMLPVLLKPAALMPTPLAVVTPPRVSAEVVVALSEPAPPDSVAEENVLPGFDSVTPLPLTLMLGRVSALFCVTAPRAVTFRPPNGAASVPSTMPLASPKLRLPPPADALTVEKSLAVLPKFTAPPAESMVAIPPTVIGPLWVMVPLAETFSAPGLLAPAKFSAPAEAILAAMLAAGLIAVIDAALMLRVVPLITPGMLMSPATLM